MKWISVAIVVGLTLLAACSSPQLPGSASKQLETTSQAVSVLSENDPYFSYGDTKHSPYSESFGWYYETFLTSLLTNENCLKVEGVFDGVEATFILNKTFNGSSCPAAQQVSTVVTDEMSEVMLLYSMSSNAAHLDVMTRFKAGLELLVVKSNDSERSLPCWKAQVNTINNTVTCLDNNSASDATARFALAFYIAAANPTYSSKAQEFKEYADHLIDKHMCYEYASFTIPLDPSNPSPDGCPSNSAGYPSAYEANLLMTRFLAEGSGEAQRRVTNIYYPQGETVRSYTGYYPDVMLALIAAIVSNRDLPAPQGVQRSDVAMNRLKVVAEQFLIAAEIQPNSQTFRVPPGVHYRFSYNDNTQEIHIIKESGNDWDEADAPRAMMMPQVMRALELADIPTQGTALEKLGWWSQELVNQLESPQGAYCFKFTANGTCLNRGASNLHEQLAFVASGLTHLTPNLANQTTEDVLRRVLNSTLSRYDWTAQPKRFLGTNFTDSFYDVKPFRVLAHAIGRDAAAFGGVAAAQPVTGNLHVNNYLPQHVIDDPNVQINWELREQGTGEVVRVVTQNANPVKIQDLPANKTLCLYPSVIQQGGVQYNPNQVGHCKTIPVNGWTYMDVSYQQQAMAVGHLHVNNYLPQHVINDPSVQVHWELRLQGSNQVVRVVTENANPMKIQDLPANTTLCLFPSVVQHGGVTYTPNQVGHCKTIPVNSWTYMDVSYQQQ